MVSEQHTCLIGMQFIIDKDRVGLGTRLSHAQPTFYAAYSVHYR